MFDQPSRLQGNGKRESQNPEEERGSIALSLYKAINNYENDIFAWLHIRNA